MFTSHRTIKWIENLAEQELLIRAGERVSIDICTTKEEVLSVETATFVRELFYHVDYMVQLFNLRVSQPALQIKVLKNGGDRLDGFSLARNGMRLVFTLAQPGVVSIVCEKLVPSDGLTGTRSSVMSAATVEAHYGTFDDVAWQFLGSPVTAEQVARHHLTEFIRTSRGNDGRFH